MSDNAPPPAGGGNQNTALQQKGPLGTLSDMLQKYKDQIAIALPKHLTPERMIRVALTAVGRSELLQKCSATTIAGCVVQSSLLGLECDGALGEAYLVPFWNSKAPHPTIAGKKGAYECQFMVGYQGLIKLVRNTDELIMIDAQEVRANDFFEYESGLDPYLRHKVDPKSDDRGEITHYWAAATLKGGGRQFVVMTVKEIEEHRDKYSKGAFETEFIQGQGKVFKRDGQGNKILQGPWRDSPEWMFKKTVLRKLCKLLPKSAQAQLAVQLDETTEAGIPQRFTVDVPIELHQTGVDDDEGDVADQMRASTEAGAADLSERLKNQQGGESSAGSGSAKKTGCKKKKERDAPEGTDDEGSQAGGSNGQVVTAETEATTETPEEYPAFAGNAQAQNVKEMPSAEEITQSFTLAKEAGVKPSKEATRLYGINPDELSKDAMQHFLGYLQWLIKKKHGAEDVAAANA